MLDDVPELGLLEVTTDFADHDEIKPAVWPGIGQQRRLDFHVRQFGDAPPRERDGVFGGICRDERAVATAGLEGARIAFVGKRGECERPLAPFVPAMRDLPDGIAVALRIIKALLGIVVVCFHVSTTSKDRLSHECGKRARLSAIRQKDIGQNAGP